MGRPRLSRTASVCVPILSVSLKEVKVVDLMNLYNEKFQCWIQTNTSFYELTKIEIVTPNTIRGLVYCFVLATVSFQLRKHNRRDMEREFSIELHARDLWRSAWIYICTIFASCCCGWENKSNIVRTTDKFWRSACVLVFESFFLMAQFHVPHDLLFKFRPEIPFLRNSTRLWRTDGRTDGQTDGTFYRDAWSYLKRIATLHLISCLCGHKMFFKEARAKIDLQSWQGRQKKKERMKERKKEWKKKRKKEKRKKRRRKT